AADIKRADALGRIELVAGDGQQIDAELIHVDWNLANRLRRVGVDERADGAGGTGNPCDRLQGADLVLGMDDRHKGGVAIDGVDAAARIDASVRVRADAADSVPGAFQQFAALVRGGMFDRRRDDGASVITGGGSADRDVARLRSTACEHDLVRLGAEQGGNV